MACLVINPKNPTTDVSSAVSRRVYLVADNLNPHEASDEYFVRIIRSCGDYAFRLKEVIDSGRESTILTPEEVKRFLIGGHSQGIQVYTKLNYFEASAYLRRDPFVLVFECEAFIEDLVANGHFRPDDFSAVYRKVTPLRLMQRREIHNYK